MIWYTKINCDGKLLEKKQFIFSSLLPHKKGTILLDITVPDSGKCYLKVSSHFKTRYQCYGAGSRMGIDKIFYEKSGWKKPAGNSFVGTQEQKEAE